MVDLRRRQQWIHQHVEADGTAPATARTVIRPGSHDVRIWSRDADPVIAIRVRVKGRSTPTTWSRPPGAARLEPPMWSRPRGAAHVEPPAESQPSVEALATNSGVNVTWVCACSGFVASSMTSWAAVRPSSWRGWRTDVSGTAAADANSMSS